MENEQGLLSGLVSEYDLGDLSEEEEEGAETTAIKASILHFLESP